jgi:APA family basic amino acid/polyamine antiporter
MLFIIPGELKIVASLANFMIFVTFAIINASVIRLRLSKPMIRGCFRSPFCIGKIPILPVFGMLFCLFMLANIGYDVMLYGIALTLLGMILYESEAFEVGSRVNFLPAKARKRK